MGSPVIDLHCDSVKFLSAGVDLRLPNPEGHVDLPRLRKGGVGVQTFAAFVASSVPAEASFAAALDMLDRIDEFAASDPALVRVETARDCREAIAGGRVGILSAVENGRAIEDSLENLRTLRRRGVRILTLVHSRDTSWAASCTGAAAASGGASGGLSAFGESVVREMNSLGIIVDLSHASESAFWDALRVSKKPVIASHSCARALCDSPRNLKDDQLRALADSGGVVGVCFFPAFLSDAYRRGMDEVCGDIFGGINDIEKKFAGDSAGLLAEYIRINARLAARLADIPVPMARIADHIDHMVRLAGEDAVAFGSDFDGIFSVPDGVSGCDFYPSLEAELRRRGYSGGSLAKFTGLNFLRVLAEHDEQEDSSWTAPH